MGEKGVDSIAIAYSPNGSVTSEAEYLARYPGDEYVDIAGLDQYHDKPHKGDGYFRRLSASLNVLYETARKHDKVPALTETGYRALETENGYFEGLAPMENTVSDWFTQTLNEVTSSEAGRHLAYMLIWSNFSDTQFWLPFVTEGFRHEMCDDFMAFAKDPRIRMAPLFDFGE